jgi:hypothetical protein
MNLHNKKPASNYEVQNWLIKTLKLTKQQELDLINYEFIRFSPFYFYKKKERVDNVWFRLTLIFFPFIWILIFISLPINFIITGRWGYDERKNVLIKLIHDWMNKLRL